MSDPRITSGDPLAGYTSPPPPGAGGVATADAVRARPSRADWQLSGWWRRVGAHADRRDRDRRSSRCVFFGDLRRVRRRRLPGRRHDRLHRGVLGILGFGLCVVVAALLYAPLMMAKTNGKTLGRMACGIRVVRANGQPIDFGYALLREVVVKWLLFDVDRRLVHLRPRGADRLPVAALGRGEPRAPRLRRGQPDDPGLGDDAAAAAARLLRPASVQITWSRPGPTPISAIGTPMKSEMYAR